MMNYVYEGPKKQVGDHFQDLELSDGDVLLVRIPPNESQEKFVALVKHLDQLFEQKGFLKRGISWVTVTTDIGLHVLKVRKGKTKNEAIKETCTRLRLIRVGSGYNFGSSYK
jgi:hypothetical protein